MRVIIYTYTDNGKKLAKRLENIYPDANLSESGKPVISDFENNDLLIFIGACGIAVRLIAPFVKDKLKDPAVIVVDELGKNIIPILSGHVGRANEYACELAKALEAYPVITTATDINEVMAIDEFAAKNGLDIVNRDNIKKVSSGLMKGKPVNIALDDDVIITSSRRASGINEKVLGLVYQPVVVGLGMRKGIEAARLEEFFINSLREVNLEPKDVAGIASIDIKEDEVALIELSSKFGIPLFFYTAAELRVVEGEFEASIFVEQTVGVSDVSGRAAKALGKEGSFILDKKKYDGMTISIFKKLRRVTFEY